MATTPRQGDVPGVRLRRAVRLPGVPPDRVRAWLLDGRRLERWLASEFEPGSSEVVESESEGCWTGSLRLVGWRAETAIAIELRATADGCELAVEQSGFERLPLSDCLTVWQACRRRWDLALGQLAAALAEAAGTACGSPSPAR